MNRAGKPHTGQSTIEYLVLFSVIAAALITTTVYMKRGMQGKMKTYTEQLGELSGYSPGATFSASTVTKNSQEHVDSFTERDQIAAETIKISESTSHITQRTHRLEGTLSFADEPERMAR